MKEETCHECGAKLEQGNECNSYFHTMITWDFEDFSGAGQVHHMTVLSYYLQHPSIYSPEGLTDAMFLLQQIIEENLTDQELFARNKHVLDSKERDWKIQGTPERHGAYEHPILWTITADKVVAGGIDNYVENVKNWTFAIYSDLKNSRNLPQQLQNIL